MSRTVPVLRNQEWQSNSRRLGFTSPLPVAKAIFHAPCIRALSPCARPCRGRCSRHTSHASPRIRERPEVTLSPTCTCPSRGPARIRYLPTRRRPRWSRGVVIQCQSTPHTRVKWLRACLAWLALWMIPGHALVAGGEAIDRAALSVAVRHPHKVFAGCAASVVPRPEP